MEYKRKQFKEVLDRLNERRGKIQVILGPRQVGKSTLIAQVLAECDIPSESYSADDIVGDANGWLSEIWENQRLRMLSRGEEKRILVIDEIQKVPNWSETVKAEWDRDTKEKRQLVVVLLGSSRLLISKGLTESLTGRFELIRMTHWSFDEMKQCFGLSLEQYIYFGGYPGSVEYIGNESRWSNYVRDSLVEPSITKDVLFDTKISKPQLLHQLFDLGCGYSGEILSLTKIAGSLQDAGNVTTLAGYLHLLDECGLLCGLQKYAEDNARKYSSIPKFQVHNSALRSVNSGISFSEAMENSKIWGRFVESAVGAYLVSQASLYNYKVYYWRSGDYEVDFILAKSSKKVAIEVKSGRRTANDGLQRFKEEFKPVRSVVVGTGGLSVDEFLSMDLNLLWTL